MICPLKKELSMKNMHIFTAVVVLALAAGCGQGPDKGQVVARINRYQATVDDFRQEAAMNLPGASRDQILDDMITKELFLEQAQKMGLDKDERFMKEIENYWKQTLIKRLIRIKGEEFLAAAVVGDDEVKAGYDRLVEESEGRIGPYEKVAGRIREALKREKAQAMLDAWVTGLRKAADVKIYDDVLKGIDLRKLRSEDGGADEK
jgi:hypothetical protein